jgi:predicted DNA-binding transcriptional regulator AlpA
MTPSPQAILTIQEVLFLTSLSRASLYRAIKAGLFPAPAKISLRRIGWTADAVTTWFETLGQK